MCYRSSFTNLDTVLGKLPVELFAEKRDIPEPIAAPGVEGAILTTRALRSRGEMYTSVPRIPATGGRNVLKEGGGPLRWYMYCCLCPSLHAALMSGMISDTACFLRIKQCRICD